MDETPCYFVIPRSSTIDKKGVQKTTSAEHLRFTVALIAGEKKMFSAFRLRPILVCKHLVNRPPGRYPFGMQVLASKSGK